MSSSKTADPKYYEALNWIKERVSSRPKIGVVCGSGLGKFADTLKDVTSFDYKDIPHFPVSTVEGHKVKVEDDGHGNACSINLIRRRI